MQEKQFRLQQELEKAEMLENLEGENKLKLAKILHDLDSVEIKATTVVLTSIKFIVDSI